MVRERVLLKVRLPATMRTYEFSLPYDMVVGQGALLVARILASREPALYEVSGHPCLMFGEGETAGTLLDARMTFRDAVLGDELTDGSLLVLV